MQIYLYIIKGVLLIESIKYIIIQIHALGCIIVYFKGGLHYMNCTKCTTGTIKVYLHGETKTIFSETSSGWKKVLSQTLGYNRIYGKCDVCKEEYFVNENKFYNQGEIEVYTTDIKVQICSDENGTSLSLVVYEHNEELYKLIESLGWVVDEGMDILPLLPPARYEKYYNAPKGSGIFGGLDKKESEALITKTGEVLSKNSIPYSTKIMTLADIL